MTKLLIVQDQGPAHSCSSIAKCFQSFTDRLLHWHGLKQVLLLRQHISIRSLQCWPDSELDFLGSKYVYILQHPLCNAKGFSLAIEKHLQLICG